MSKIFHRADRLHRLAVAGLSLALAMQASHWQAAAEEYGVDRPGQDYLDFDLQGANPAECYQACARNAMCRAWTYVQAGVQGPQPRCWLKTGVPNAVKNDCCVSGVMPAVAAPSVKLTCAREIDQGYATAELRIRNFGPTPVPAGAVIDYRLSTGETGSVIADGISPGGSEIYDSPRRASDPAFTCTAALRG